MEKKGGRKAGKGVAVRKIDGRFRYAVVLLAVAFLLCAALLGGCAAPQKAVKPGKAPEDPGALRLPILTPLRIEQSAPPPGAEQSISPVEVQEGKAHSLKLFQVDLRPGKKGPPVDEDLTGLDEDAPGPPEDE